MFQYDTFRDENSGWSGINKCLNNVEKTIIITSATLFLLATVGTYYAYKVLRNYQIRPFWARFCVKPAEYYFARGSTQFYISKRLLLQ